MTTVRRLLLEFAAIMAAGVVIGFLGPFGSYRDAPLLARIARWLSLLIGAYILGRPMLLLLDRLAEATDLPRSAVRAIGVLAASGPLALLWTAFGFRELQSLDSVAGAYSFALLCLLCVVLTVGWAERADDSLRASAYPSATTITGTAPVASSEIPGETPPPAIAQATPAPVAPRLMERLSGAFRGPILALESEDHYVRVHGSAGSELLLMRLRDAAAEMDDVAGVQTHRSWWVARAAIAGFSGGTRRATLVNGLSVPIARDTLARLQRGGFLPVGDDAVGG